MEVTKNLMPRLKLEFAITLNQFLKSTATIVEGILPKNSSMVEKVLPTYTEIT